jgi:ferric hydroxamate transport system ATP-binding protein
VSLGFRPGAFCGLIGHNGSGKSTFLKILARQQPPGSGRVLFAGRPLADWPGRAFARRVAYLPQSLPPATGLTVRELVGFGRYPWRGPFARLNAADHAAVAAAMARCRLEPLADRLVDTLSGGERQRVWLAMLVAQDARCLLLDEPTSALDVGHQLEVLSLIRDLAHKDTRSVVIVLHDVNMAARFCDRILALRDGRLVANENVAGFMTIDLLEAVYGLRMKILPHPAHAVGIAIPC